MQAELPFQVPSHLISPIGNLHKFKFSQIDKDSAKVSLRNGVLAHRFFSFKEQHVKTNQDIVVFNLTQPTNFQTAPSPNPKQKYVDYVFKDIVELGKIVSSSDRLYLYDFPLKASPAAKNYDDFILVNFPVTYVEKQEIYKPVENYAGEIKMKEFNNVRGDLHVHFYEGKKATYSIDLTGFKDKVFGYKERSSK